MRGLLNPRPVGPPIVIGAFGGCEKVLSILNQCLFAGVDQQLNISKVGSSPARLQFMLGHLDVFPGFQKGGKCT